MSSSIFLLGATGYVGGELLASISKEFPDYSVTGLLRSATDERISQLKAIHSKVKAVEGDLMDAALIEEEAAKADIVINVAAGGHVPSVSATLKGLKKRSAANPGSPPLYIHMSGTGVTADRANGELLMPERIWKDSEFKLSDCPNPEFSEACLDIIAAGTDKDVPIRTIIVFPGAIYGLGTGTQKVSMGQRAIVNLAKAVGQAGTVGPGRNVMNIIHVKDVASSVTTILRAALAGTADEGEEGLYFVVSKHLVNMGEFTRIIGDVLHKYGLVARAGAQPLPQAVKDSMGPSGSLFGSNMFCRGERLEKFGWSPKYSEEISVYQSIAEEIEQIVKE